ncbi:hypothetical protein BHE74_00012449 [Ensete ventricosum]|nr:hypothetical protein GW17_00030217 [Ensete ventricosum]RWW79274.1 hypothetical protein BHE74_00012449 [Ensete ventricosum]
MKDNLLGEETYSQMDTPDDVKIRSIDGSSSSRHIAEEALSLGDVNSETYSHGANSNVPVESSTMGKTQAATKSEPDTRSAICGSVPSEITTEAEEETTPAKKVDGSSGFSDAVKSNNVHLNIRIPNGTSLQTKLTLADTLRSVKIFVDENLDIVVGSYDLAVPYPRKLFNDEGPNPALQNHLSGSGAPRRLSSSSDQSNQNTDSHNTSGGVRPRPSRQFGSNIHTLRHDDDPSGDKNMFWNGNSTQFGGDDKK